MKADKLTRSHEALEQAIEAIPSCALSEAGLKAQHERMLALGPNVRDFKRLRDQVTIEFAPGYDRRLLEDTVAVEKECCPFFRFDFAPSERRLTVSVDDPEHRAGLDALQHALGLPQRAS